MLANAPTKEPFDKLPRVGLAVRALRAPGIPYQAHIGILYREAAESPVMLLHFPAHQKLNHETPTLEYLWVSCSLDQINQQVLAARLPQIFKRAVENKIPYGISFDGSYFDGEGRYTRYRPQDGLTCATFVMAVSGWRGFAVLDQSAWPIRPADEGWQTYMIKEVMEKRWKQGRAKIKAQLALVGTAARFRPEEVVVASATYTVRPLQFKEVEKSAEELEGQVANHSA